MKHQSIAQGGARTLLVIFFCVVGNHSRAQTQNTTRNYQYDAMGNLSQIVDPLGRSTNLSYDALNRLKQQLLPSPLAGKARPIVAQAYDALDQLSSITDPRNLVTSYSYDGLANRNSLISPDRGIEGATFDVAGNMLTSTDARGKTKTYSYDALNRVTRISYMSGMPTVFEYDGGNENLVNAIGRLSKMSDESGHTTYLYDQTGRLLKKEQTSIGTLVKLSHATTYTYDSNGKLATMSYPSGRRISYSYDGAGQINAMVANTTVAGTVIMDNIVYAPFGAAKSWRWGNSNSSNPNEYARSFDLDGRMVTYPLGNTAGTRLNFDSQSAFTFSGLIYNPVTKLYGGSVQVKNLGSNPISGMARMEFSGLPVGCTLNNATGEVNGTPYVRLGQTLMPGASISLPLFFHNPNSAQLTYSAHLLMVLEPGATRTVDYDAASNVVAYKHAGNEGAASLDQSFGYDGLDRLISVTTVGGNQGFTYDASGNRILTTSGAATYFNAISATSNRLASTTGPVPARSNIYDASGNLNSDGTIQYIYDDRGRLKNTVNAGVSTTYSYNGLGQRIAKAGSLLQGGMSFYVYDELGRMLGEYDAFGKPLQETVYLGETPVAVMRPATAVSNTALFYVYTDHLNAPRVIVNSSTGGIAWRWYSADPFGVVQPEEDPSGDGIFVYNLRFPGQNYDRETNLHYNYFRDYDPQTGRYVQSDPIGPAGGINTYIYADASPIVKSDPMGLATYMCTQPLHALGAMGRFAYSPDSNPLYHQFIGIIRPDGSIITGGQDRAGGPWSPGVPSKGDGTAESGAECRKAEDDNECIEKCLMGKFASSRPPYALTLSGLTNNGQNCQDWAKDTLAQCQSTCKAHK